MTRGQTAIVQLAETRRRMEREVKELLAAGQSPLMLGIIGARGEGWTLRPRQGLSFARQAAPAGNLDRAFAAI